jgi:hypothetical protein
MPTTIPSITSSTRPGSPSAGDAYFETDTQNYIIYDGAYWYVYNYDDTTAFSNTLSLSFDGGDDIETTYNAATSTFSMSVWIKALSGTSMSFGVTSGNNSIGSQGPTILTSTSVGAGGGNGFLIAWKGYNTGWAPAGLGGANAALDILDGEWHHLAYTINGTSIKLYKDGGDAAINTGSPTNTQGTPFGTFTASTALSASGFDSSYPFRIGSLSNGYYYTGKKDELALFESELSGSDVSAIYNSGVPTDVGSQGLNLSPSAYFRMGDGSSDTNSSGGTPSNADSVGTLTSLVGGYTATQSSATRKPTYSNDVPS